MADAKTVTLVSSRTGSVVTVPEEKADALKTLGFAPQDASKKAPAERTASKK